MKKYQSLEDYYTSQPVQFQPLLYLIRETVLATDPAIREVLKYGMSPFFVSGTKQKVVCYLGVLHPKTGIEVGFPSGQRLPDPHGLLQTKGRKVVSGITFREVDDLVSNADAFQELVREAVQG